MRINNLCMKGLNISVESGNSSETTATIIRQKINETSSVRRGEVIFQKQYKIKIL